MLRYRLLSAAVLIPLVLGLAYLGGVWFLGLVLVALTLAGYEYVSLLKQAGNSPSLIFVVVTIWLFALDAYFPQAGLLRPGLTASVLCMLTWAVARYERGQNKAVTDWAWTAAGSLYLGWMGAHFVLTRNIGVAPHTFSLAPAQGEGLGWATLALSSAWLADSGAYLVGHTWGRRKLASRVSPNKTWEGWVGGIVLGTLGSAAVAALIGVIAPALGSASAPTLRDGLALGALIALFSPLGDLGESLIKRHVGAKDSGQLVPGHGGMFDRIDSLLWAAVIAYYYATWIARIAPH